MILNKKEINIPIYFGKLIIFNVEKMSDLNEKFNFNADDSWDSYCFKKLLDDYTMTYCIAINVNNISFSIVAHEVVHLVNYIFEHVGVQLDLHNDEAQAYFTGWVFEQIENFIKENKK